MEDNNNNENIKLSEIAPLPEELISELSNLCIEKEVPIFREGHSSGDLLVQEIQGGVTN